MFITQFPVAELCIPPIEPQEVCTCSKLIVKSTAPEHCSILAQMTGAGLELERSIRQYLHALGGASGCAHSLDRSLAGPCWLMGPVTTILSCPVLKFESQSLQWMLGADTWMEHTALLPPRRLNVRSSSLKICT